MKQDKNLDKTNEGWPKLEKTNNQYKRKSMGKKHAIAKSKKNT